MGDIIMAYTITFGSLTLSGNPLPLAGQREIERQTATSSKLLLSGKYSVQTNVNTSNVMSFDCRGSFADFLALLALVGTFQTLTVTGPPSGTETYTNCTISGSPSAKQIGIDVYQYKVEFTQQTA